MENTRYFRKGLKDAGFDVMGNSDDCPIVPVKFVDPKITYDMATVLLQKYNILLVPIRFPVVPMYESRIRCVITSTHTTEQIKNFLRDFTKCGKELGAIPDDFGKKNPVVMQQTETELFCDLFAHVVAGIKAQAKEKYTYWAIASAAAAALGFCAIKLVHGISKN